MYEESINKICFFFFNSLFWLYWLEVRSLLATFSIKLVIPHHFQINEYYSQFNFRNYCPAGMYFLLRNNFVVATSPYLVVAATGSSCYS